MKLTNKQKSLFLVAILISTFLPNCDFVFSPTINALYETFPNQPNLVNFMVSGAALINIFMGVVVGKVVAKVGGKAVLVGGSVLIAASTICFTLFMNPYWMIAMRICKTIGYISMTISTVSVIHQIYTDEKDSGKVMGYYNTALSVTGIILSLVAGFLANSDAFNAYKAYWAFIPIAILVALFTPKTEPTGAADKKEKTKTKGGLGKNYWVSLLMYTIWIFTYTTPYFFVSVYVASNNLGSSAMVGGLNTIATIAGVMLALSFGKVSEKLGRNTLVLGYIFMFASLGLLLFVPQVATTYVAFFLQGASYMTVATYSYAKFPTLVPKEKIDDAISYVAVAGSIGTFITSFAVKNLMSAMNWTLSESLMLPFVCCGIVMLFELFIGRRMGDQAAEQAS